MIDFRIYLAATIKSYIINNPKIKDSAFDRKADQTLSEGPVDFHTFYFLS